MMMEYTVIYANNLQLLIDNVNKKISFSAMSLSQAMCANKDIVFKQQMLSSTIKRILK